jgi:hypothetical protein
MEADDLESHLDEAKAVVVSEDQMQSIVRPMLLGEKQHLWDALRSTVNHIRSLDSRTEKPLDFESAVNAVRAVARESGFPLTYDEFVASGAKVGSPSEPPHCA